MVIVKTTVNQVETPYYMDGWLHNRLTKKVIPRVHKKDKDWVCLIDGEERAGKSVFAQQLAKTLDPSFTHERMCHTGEEFKNAIINAKKHEAIVFDEAINGLDVKGSLSRLNRELVRLMMEMGQKNLFVIVVLPTFFMLDKYVVFFRSKGLFHVYENRGRQGFWRYYGKVKKRMLYIQGKKYYNYGWPRTRRRGRFNETYLIDENEYRAKKRRALEQRDEGETGRADKVVLQRDALIKFVYNTYKIKQSQIVKGIEKWGSSIDQGSVSRILRDKQHSIGVDEALNEEKPPIPINL